MTFDLERARGLRDFLQDDCAEVGDVWAEMIAEIERLQASLVEHEEHENQTHAILGAILGTDDTLENVAKRAAASIKELEAEIERLRAENLELQGEVFGPDGIRANQACIIADQAARISELEIEIAELKSDLEQSEEIKRLKDELENYGDHYACLLISKDAQIKELEGMLSIRTEELDIAHSVARSEKEMHEKELAAFARRIKELEEALVEMVATNPCNIPTLCDVVHDELMCPALDGNCDFWKGCPQKNELREAARKQLQAEGKIGPDAKPRSWQITDERKAAIWHAIKVLKENDIMEEPEEHLWDEEVTVLQAMLREAGQ